jgi:hypothetical protein
VVAQDFGPIIDVARVMDGYRRPWFVSGGWAIDLFVGQVTRTHKDVEVGAYHADQDALSAHLAAWRLSRIRNDAWERWRDGDPIELPEFQIQALSDVLAPHIFDVFLNPLDGPDWVSRRHSGLRVPAEAVAARAVPSDHVPLGVPYLVPQIQLLYKAKYHRPEDDADFEAAVGLMNPAQRRWLRDALQAHHPGDPWIARL